MKRAEAKLPGLKTYNTGKPCKHGHFADRYTIAAKCVECAVVQSTAWRVSNPENIQVIPKALNRAKRNQYIVA